MGKRRNVWIRSNVSEKLDVYLISQELLGSKTTITNVINDVLEEYLDKNEVDQEFLKQLVDMREDTKRRRPKWD